MKNLILSVVCVLTAAALPLDAQTLIDNDFSSVTSGTYSGATGESFGTAAALGNATFQGDVEVLSTGGVGNSAYLELPGERGMRSRNTASTTTATSFSFNFLASQDANNNDRGALGVGWNISPDNSDLHNATSTERENRLLVGLRYDNGGTTGSTTDDFFQLGYMTEFTGAQITDFTGSNVTFAAPSTQTWYSMSFDLQFNDSTDIWTVSSLEVRDGSASLVASISSDTFSLGTSNLNSTTTANAVLAGWGNKNGVDGFDNVSVSAVPEPAGAVLVLAGLGVLFAGRRRRTTVA